MRDCPSYNLKYRIRYVLVKERYCLGSAHTAAKPHKPLFHSRIKLFVRVAANRHPESPVSIHRHLESIYFGHPPLADSAILPFAFHVLSPVEGLLLTLNLIHWRRWESNPRPLACKAGALPTELRPRVHFAGNPKSRFSIFDFPKHWAREDSDFRPHAYQACALNQLSYEPDYSAVFDSKPLSLPASRLSRLNHYPQFKEQKKMPLLLRYQRHC